MIRANFFSFKTDAFSNKVMARFVYVSSDSVMFSLKNQIEPTRRALFYHSHRLS